MKKYLGLSVISTALLAFAFQIPFGNVQAKTDQVQINPDLVIESQNAQTINYDEPGEVIDFQAETE